ncbi:hypothetical protein, partial [Actinoplanes sp. NPDC049265]|uniref:hypothetical protein n=1 Tax=Actinoplanes sp. NPDC049265 TaxID=3363902 RepID=UPI0037106A30
MADHQVNQADGSVMHYDAAGQAIRQVAPDGQVTTFDYRAAGQYVATTGDHHTLFSSDGVQIKQWAGLDESSAAFYHRLSDGDYSLTDPTGAVTEYTADGELIRQTVDGHVTTFEHRPGGQYVATTGDQHVLYGADGVQLKLWTGADEAQAATFHQSPDGGYTLTDPSGAVTEYNADGEAVRPHTAGPQPDAAEHSRPGGGRTVTDSNGDVTEFSSDGHLVRQVADGQVTTFQYRGDDYVATTGDQHVLYGSDGVEIKQWTGADESQAAAYHKLAGGRYSLTDPNGDVTEFSSDGHLVRQVADGQVTTFQYRGDD